MYTTNISFGSPPQNFRAIIDINWAEPFVPSATCKDKICKKFLWYNSNASSTYIGNGTIAEIEYLPVKAEGYISSDILRIGEHLTLPSTTFVELKQYDDLFADNELSTFDTVLGFAIEKEWPAVNYGKSDRIPSQFRQMVNKEVLDRNIFSILFPRSQSEIGSIMFGGYDKDQAKGELVRHPLFPNNTTQWSIGLNELRFKVYGASDATYLGNQEAKSQWIAQLTSRSPYIGLPRDIVDSLFHHINWKRSACSYRPIVDCNRLGMLPELTFVIDGQYISLKGTEYVERIKPAYDWSSPWLCKGPPEEQEEECVPEYRSPTD
jgi:saccharopepsin